MKLKTVLFLLLSFSFHIVYAQEEPSWPPDPTTIFTSNVEIVETEVIKPNDPYLDYQSGILKIYDEINHEWRNLSLPQEVNEDARVTKRSDGVILLYQHAPDARAWFVRANTFKPIDLTCADHLGSLYHEYVWGIAQNSETGSKFLCFIETGEWITELPANTAFITPSQSPDEKYVVLLGYENEEYTLYSYDVETKDTLQLGKFQRTSGESYWPQFDQWVSNTRGFIRYTNPPGWDSDSFYAFDTTQPGSVELIRGSFGGILSNPPRYEEITTTGLETAITGAEVEHSPCELTVYDAKGVRRHNLGYDCGSTRLFYSHGRYFYVRIDDENSTTATLTGLNPENGRTIDYYSAEIEWFHSLSPDNHYALFVLDTNGKIDLVNYYPQHGADAGAIWNYLPETAYVTVVDLQHGHVVYDTRSINSPIYRTIFIAEWCGNDCLLYTFGSGLTQLRMLENGLQVSRTGIEYRHNMEVSPDQTRLLVPDSRHHYIFDFSTFQSIPITLPDVPFDVQGEWNDNDQLKVKVTEMAHEAIYTIRLNPDAN